MSKLSELQESIRARLSSCEALKYEVGENTRTIPILKEDATDLETEINKAVDGLGIMALIGMPVLKVTEPDIVPANSLVELEIAIAENVLLNRDEENAESSKIRCSDAAQFIAQRLMGFKPSAAWSKLRVTDIAFVPDKKKQIYEVRVETDTMLNPI